MKICQKIVDIWIHLIKVLHEKMWISETFWEWWSHDECKIAEILRNHSQIVDSSISAPFIVNLCNSPSCLLPLFRALNTNKLPSSSHLVSVPSSVNSPYHSNTRNENKLIRNDIDFFIFTVLLVGMWFNFNRTKSEISNCEINEITSSSRNIPFKNIFNVSFSIKTKIKKIRYKYIHFEDVVINQFNKPNTTR